MVDRSKAEIFIWEGAETVETASIVIFPDCKSASSFFNSFSSIVYCLFWQI